MNRRYISDCVPLKLRMQASAGFVSASALGMACGPGLAGLLQTNFKIYKLTFNQETLPGWLMAISWLIYLIWLWFSFKEPVRDTEINVVPQASKTGMSYFSFCYISHYYSDVAYIIASNLSFSLIFCNLLTKNAK